MASTSSRPVSRTRSRSQSRSRAGSRGGAAQENDNDYSNGTGTMMMSEGDSDFCNSFWSSGQPDEPGQERGYETLMAKVKNSGRMLEEFRAFFKERQAAAIEEDYARRLAKLARMPLGKEESGEFGNVLRRVQYEVDQSGRCHNELAGVIRQTMENRVKEFEASRDQRRRNTQTTIERAWKNKQNQEVSVQKALEKYKSDCILINSFSARLSLTQGKDMDRVTSKLEKAQSTVQTNEAEYKNYLRALKDTQGKWVGEWKSWCDLIQDLEEEKMEFARNALWSYVNAVSLICVKDDESCENIRQVVEMCDVRRDLQRFVNKEGGGNMITDPPHFTDFSDGDKGTLPPVSHPAKFSRSSAKVEQPPFDGLERLQAAVYPQQNGGRPKSVAASTNGPTTPGVQTPAVTGEDRERQRTRTPAPTPGRENSSSRVPVNNNDTTPQQAACAAAARPASPSKRSSQQGQEMSSNYASVPQPAPPPVFNASRSRPASRAGDRLAADEGQQKPDSNQTTAEVLQHKASQKRLSASAFKTGTPTQSTNGMGNGAPPNPNYPYASASPRTAKPYEPDSGADLRSSPSAILPPPSSTSGPNAPNSTGPSAVTNKRESKEDPLLAALAKLRSPSSAVDVLPPSSPGIPGGTGPGAIALPGMGRPGQTQQQQQQQQQPRSHSPYGNPGQQPQQQYMQQPPQQMGMGGRRSPSMPAVQQQQAQQQRGGSNQYPLPGQSGYGRPGPGNMAASQSHPAHMGGGAGSPAPPNQYTQARSRPASPNPQMMQGGPPPQQHQQQQRAPSPSAAMMRPPSANTGAGAPSGAGYGQAFPGERRQSIAIPAAQGPSRPSSPGGLRSPTSAGGFAGVGAPQQQQVQQGRASPAPGYPQQQQQQMHPSQMRSPSPGPPSAPGAGYPGGQGQPGYGGSGYQQQQTYRQQQARPQSAYQPSPVPVQQGSLRGQQGHRPSASYGGHPSAAGAGAGFLPLHQSQSTGAGRPTTPLGGGISLDASGQVMQDNYNSRQQTMSPGGQQQPSYGAGGASPMHPQSNLPAQQQSAGFRHGASIYGRNNAAHNPNRQSMGSPAPPSAQQGQQPMSPNYSQQPQPAYAQQGQVQQANMYPRAASPYQQPPQQQQQQSPYGQPQAQSIGRSQSIGYSQGPPPQQQQPQQHGMQASQSYRGQPGPGYGAPPPQQQHPAYSAPPPQAAVQQQRPQQQQQQQQQPLSVAPSAPTQAPLQSPGPGSRPPTGQYTESGYPILFYVKAIYKYDAGSPEEFSFQKDDVIGVFETDDDGWWKGELLDPERARRSGGNVFPSNFTTFLD